MAPRSILHSDMNNFYASVECMLDPKLREHPIAVCGSVEERHGIVLAKNYAAKAYKVQTGDAIWQAKEKCPGLVIVPPHYDEYLKYSKKAREIYSRFTNEVEPYGMDECWLDLTGTEGLFGSPEDVANQIREIVKFELGLTVSVGVSFNKIFAKLGSDMKKPDAVTVIPKETFRDIVWGLPATDLLGVGRATQKELDRYFIKTIGDLARQDIWWMEKHFGKRGIMLSQYANGQDQSPVMPIGYSAPVKSVGHGTTTRVDLKSNGEVWAVILELTQDIGHRLREYRKVANGVAIHVRDTDLHFKQWQALFDFPTQSTRIIAQEAFRLFERRYPWQKEIRSITVQAINLLDQDAPCQTTIFTDVKKIEKLERLEACVETIRYRFGKDSIKNLVLCGQSVMPEEHTPVTMPTGMFSP